MKCFLKKLFGQKCDEKKSDDLANNPKPEEEKEADTDQLSPDSEFKQEEESHSPHSHESHQNHESGNEEFKH